MMTGRSNKIHITVASAEQQENLRNTRRTLKVVQKTATDKENLTGRAIKLPGKDSLLQTQNDMSHKGDLKRKKVSSKSIQTSPSSTISVEDLTSTAKPSEHYWEILAEKRRIALEETLKENQSLHEKISGLEEEVKISKEMLAETQSLVEVLTEMLNENEEDVSVAEDALESQD